MDFFGGLRGVSAICKEACGTAGDRERCARAGEAAQVAKIREMCNEKTVQSSTGDAATELTDAAKVVHPERYITTGANFQLHRPGLIFKMQSGCAVLEAGGFHVWRFRNLGGACEVV
jgi:hypothetical protein